MSQKTDKLRKLAEKIKEERSTEDRKKTVKCAQMTEALVGIQKLDSKLKD